MHRRHIKYLTVLSAVFGMLASSPARADDLGVRAQEQSGDACLAPSVLPSGALAWCGQVGFPEVALTLREGFGWLELEGRARFDYWRLSLAGEGIAKFALVRQESWDLAPYVGVGLIYDAGGTYADSRNFSYGGFRFIAGIVTTYALSANLRFIGQLEVPIDTVVSPGGTTVVEPLAGAGLEFSLGGGWSLFGMAHAGLLVRQTAGASATVDFAPVFRAGLGFRIF